MPEKQTQQEFERRARELVSQMTLEEKASQLRYNAPPIKRLGIPAYNWWSEGLHGCARAGVATMFPQAIGMAAMFDRKLMRDIGEIISTEARAKYNSYTACGDRDIYKGLTIWSPNINIFRDPRWGRGHETYGEDPCLTGELAVPFIRGIQGEGPYLRAAACAKHFAAHSGPENLRHEFDAKVSPKELEETYLPAFEACVTRGNVESVMGAYNRTNGAPCCANPTLMEKLLRGKWKFQGHFVSDCGAIQDFHEGHRVTRSAVESAALALKCGCDLNCGSVYVSIVQAYQDGLIGEELITRAAVRVMTTRMKLGMFAEDCPYDKIPYSTVACKEHRAAAEKAAEESVVLLKNDGILPLPRSLKKIAVIGPNADSRRALMGNYHGTAPRYITVLEGIEQTADAETRIYYSEGCHLFKDRVERLALPDDRIAEAVTAAKEAGLAVLCLGLDETLEGEEGNEFNSGDRKDLSLPASQLRLLHAVADTGVPVILVNLTGSCVSLDWADACPNVRAILQGWYPGGEGGLAIARILFGEVSPSGRLPVTFYRESYQIPDFCEYSMKNRTYRFLEREEDALYPFGYGLSYASFSYSGASVRPRPDGSAELRTAVTNTGARDAEEVAEVYGKDEESPLAVRNWSLCGFERLFLKAGETREIVFEISPKAFQTVSEDGERKRDSRRFTLFVGSSQPDGVSTSRLGRAPLKLALEFD